MEKRITIILLIIITIFSFFLRLYFLNKDSLTTYELNMIGVAIRSDVTDVTYGSISAGHHPLYYYILHYWIRLFKVTDIYQAQANFMKLLSTIFNVLLIIIIPLITLFDSDLFNRESAILTAFIIAISPVHIFFSKYVSLYTFFVFLTFLSSVSFIVFLKKAKFRYALFYICSTVFMLYTHIWGYIILFTHCLYFLFVRKNIKKWALINIVIVMLYLPWHIFAFPRQLYVFQTCSPGMRALIKYDPSLPTLNTILQTFIDFSGSSFLFFLFLFIAGYGLLKERKNINQNLFFIFWLFIPPIIVYLISIHIESAYKIKALLFISLPLFILVSKGTLHFNRIIRVFIVLIIALVLFLKLFTHSFSSPSENWKGLVSDIKKMSSRSDIAISLHSQLPFNYYYKDKVYIADNVTEIENILSSKKEAGRFFFIMRWDEPEFNEDISNYLRKKYNLVLKKEYTNIDDKYGENCSIIYYLFNRNIK